MTTITIKLPQNEEKPLLKAIESGVNSAWDFFITDTLPKYYNEQGWRYGTRVAIEKLFTQRHVALKNEIIDSVSLYIDDVVNIKLSTNIKTIEHSPSVESEEAIILHPLVDPVKAAEEERIRLDADALLAWIEDYWHEPHVSLAVIQQNISHRKLYKRDVAADAVHELQKRGILIRNREPVVVKGKKPHKSWKVNLPVEQEEEIEEEAIELDIPEVDIVTEPQPIVTETVTDSQVEIIDEVAKAYHEVMSVRGLNISVSESSGSLQDKVIQDIVSRSKTKNGLVSSIFATKCYGAALVAKIPELFQKYRKLYPDLSKALICEIIYKVDQLKSPNGKPYGPRTIYNVLLQQTKGQK